MKQHKFNIYLTDYIQKNTTNTASMISEQIILNTKKSKIFKIVRPKIPKEIKQKNSNINHMAWFESCVFHITNIKNLKSVKQK